LLGSMLSMMDILPGVALLIVGVRQTGSGPALMVRKLCAWAGLTPQVGNSDRTLRHGHSTNRAHPGCAGSCRRPPRRPSATPCSPPPTASWLGVEARTSPRWPSPVGCWPAASTSSSSWKFQLNHRRRPLPGALVFPHEPAPGPPVLTEQPGSGRRRHAAPIFGARMGACEPTPNSRPGLLPRRPPPPPQQPRPPRQWGQSCTPLDRARPHGSGNAAGPFSSYTL
jgi:hypothetical protein